MAEPKVGVVVGGAGGIGHATCAVLLAEGWRVAIADLDVTAARGLTEAHPDRTLPIAVDITQRPEIDRLMQTVVDRWGAIDGLVNLAGIQRHAPLESFSDADWDAVLAVNLTSVMRCMQAAAAHMLPRGSGAVVNVGSVSGARGAAGRVAYAVSKAGVVSLTQTAAVEWATRGIRVNAVGPGYVNTNLVSSFVRAGKLDTAPILSRIPQGRMAEPVEIAHVIRFLLSAEATYITGQCLYADGGFLADYGVPFKR
jgi:3-oxoacyl-[acyl-carrier protein] reductase